MITERNNGTWLVSVGSGTGRYRKVCKTLAEAKALEAAEEARRSQERLKALLGETSLSEKDDDDESGQDTMTLIDLFKRTKQLKWVNDSGTQSRNAMRVIAMLGENRLISSIDQKMINDLVAKLYSTNNSGSTVNRKLSALSVMLKVAELDGLIPHSFRMPRQKEGKNRKRVLSIEEEKRIYKVCDRLGFFALKEYIQFTLDTGFRKNESLNIRETDIQTIIRNGQKMIFAVLHDGETKSGEGRSVPLTRRALKIVESRKGHGRIFYELSEYLLRRQWECLRDTMGLENDAGFVIHALRHTCLTRLGESGKSAVFIQKWAGHSSIMMSQQYVHVGADFLFSGVDALENIR